MLMPSIFGDSLFDDFFDDFYYPVKSVSSDFSRNNLMKTDVKENENGFELHIELPGFKKDNVKVNLKDGYLVVNANNKVENEEKDKKGKYLRKERYYGSCSRSFYVGDKLKKEDIKAKFEDGILRLDIPKIKKEQEIEENHYIEIEG